MWTPVNVTVKNFMAFKDESYDFNQGSSTMIQGKNLTDDNQESNGSCKSAMLEAIGVAILGKCIRLDASAKDLVMRGEKESFIEATLHNPLLKQTLTITRNVFSNTKSSTLELGLIQHTENGNVDATPDVTSVSEGNSIILDIIGLEAADILNYYIISKERYIPFYKQPDTKKKETIGRFANSNLVEPAESILDEDVLKISNEIELKESEISDLNIKIDTFTNEMNSFSVEDLQKRRDDKIKSLKESIDEYRNKIKIEDDEVKGIDSKIKDIENSIEEYKKDNPNNFDDKINDLEELERGIKLDLRAFDDKKDKDIKEVDKVRDNALKSINDKDNEFNAELNEIKLELKEANELLSEVDKALMDSVECPKCSHEFAPGKSLNIEKSKAKKKDIQSIINECQSDIDSVRSDISKLDEDRRKVKNEANESEKNIVDQYEKDVKSLHEKIDEYRGQVRELRDSKLKYSDQLELFQDNIKSLESKERQSIRKTKSYNEEITNLNEEIATIEEQVIKDRKSEFKDKISEVESSISKVNDDILELGKELEKAKERKSLFIRFKTHLSNKAIASIEAQSNHYLEVAKSNIRVQMDGYKETRSGDIREKITTTVFRDGFSEGGMGAFSSGEKVRIEVANILAMKNLINNSSHTGGLDLLILDEVTNSLDSTGTEGVLNMLNDTNETSLLITHSTFNSVYPHIQTVIKENNVSRIINGQYE